MSKVPEVPPRVRWSFAGPCQCGDVVDCVGCCDGAGASACVTHTADSVQLATSVLAAPNRTAEPPPNINVRARWNRRLFIRVVCSLTCESPVLTTRRDVAGFPTGTEPTSRFAAK